MVIFYFFLLNREGEFYLYTLHDPTVSSKRDATNTQIPFATLCPIVDRHTRSVMSS